MITSINIELSEPETEDFLRHMDRKIMWKDQSKKNDENLSHGATINPIRTLSTSHFWIKRNLIQIVDSDLYCYSSGCNLIIDSSKGTEPQRIIHLKPDCLVTSLFSQITSSGEKIIIVGEKIRPPVCEIENSNYVFSYSGRVEIFNLDKKKVLEDRKVLDHTYYVNYESFIYDAISPAGSDHCLTIVKNIDMSESDTKVFVWDYVNTTLLAVQDFENHIEHIVSNPNAPGQFILYALYYCAFWNYSRTKKKFSCEFVYVSDNREVADATFIQVNNFKGVCITYRSNKVEIYNKNHEKCKIFSLSEILFIVINFDNPNNNSKTSANRNAKSRTSNVLGFNVDYNMHEVNEDEENNRNSIEKTNEGEIVKDSPLLNSHLMLNLVKTFRFDPKDMIKYAIIRDKYLFIFISGCEFYFLFEFTNTDTDDKLILNLKLLNIEKLNFIVGENCSILINSKITNMVHVSGEQSNSLFKSKFENTRKTIFMQNKDKKSLKSGNEMFGFTGKNKEIEIVKHKLERLKMKYHFYKFNYINSFPCLIYTDELYPNSGTGQEVSHLAISINPRIIIAGYNKKHLNIFQQNNIDEVNLQNDIKNKTGHNYYNMMDSSTSISSHYQKYLKKAAGVHLINNKNLEQQPISITLSPYGNMFFITTEETSYLYALLDNDIKEIAKTNSYCHAASFSKSGKLLAFANSEYRTDRTDYNIIILNTFTFEVEYIISKLALPVKLTWLDNDCKILALFQETSTNILGWKLNENRLIVYNSKESGKVSKHYYENEEESNLILKITDYTEKIVDFAYDDVIDYLLICSEERRIKVIQTNKDDMYWEFPVECKYTSLLLVKKLDIILFGTSEGSIRTIIWPITNFTGKEQIDHPHFSENFLHSDNVISLIISPDLQFLYSASIDGSIYISSISAMSYDNPVNINSFAFFDNRNILNKKVHMKYSDLINMTDAVYKTKLENIDKRQTDISTLNSEFVTEMEKLMGENIKDIERKRNEMNEDIEKKRRTVKGLEDEKEILSKQLKDKRENQVKQFREELSKIKSKYKIEKEHLQTQTKTLTLKIKESRNDFSQEVARIETKRELTNDKMKESLDNLLKMLNEKYIQIEVIIKVKNEGFNVDLVKTEVKNEIQIREKDDNLRGEVCRHFKFKKEIEGEVSKIKKYNQNYDDKIKEWQSHLQELKSNNTDLMESFLFNTLKLKQMNNLLKDNEKKISESEAEIKKQRTVNDRLEQLRYVLEYQIKNLIKEKTPIEEQIKNFEELHNDFYKRFNLLYAEQLNIDEFITSNSQLIEVFKVQLKNKKQVLYNLKTLFRGVDLEISFIFKNKIEDKYSIVNKLIYVYNKYLKSYVVEENTVTNDSIENNLQAKLIEKEINKQKNKVLKDLIKRRQDRKDVNLEKDDLMVNIRLENQQLIEECSSIRMNLEDILKYITDIEKKFIELTNTHLFLNKNENTKLIRDEIKLAKKSIMLVDIDKTRVAKGNTNIRVDTNTERNHFEEFINKTHKDENSNNKMAIFKKIEENKEEMKTQNVQIEKMQKQIREVLGNDVVNKIQSQGGNNNIQGYKENISNRNSVPVKNQTQPKTSLNNEKLKHSRMISIKTKYLDIRSGSIKEIVNSDDIFVMKKKKKK